MNHNDLRQFRPFDQLSDSEIAALIGSARIEVYEDSDYIFRLGEDIDDLLYVLQGSVRMMDIEKRTDEYLSHEDERAQEPFTIEVPSASVAVAVPPARILRVDYQALAPLLEADKALQARFRPCREAEPELPEEARPDDPEPLEPPANFVLNDDKVLSRGRPFSPRKLDRKAQEVLRKAYSGYVRDDDAAGTLDKPSVLEETVRRRKSVVNPAYGPAEQAGTTHDDEKALPATTYRTATPPPEVPAEPGLQKKPAKQAKSDKAKSPDSRQASPAVEKKTPEVSPKPEPVILETAPPKRRKTSTLRDFEMFSEDSAASTIAVRETQIPEIVTAPAKDKAPAVASEKVTAPVAAEPVDESSSAEWHEKVETEEYLRALALYRKEEWEEAKAIFEVLLKINPATLLYRQYIDRCEAQLLAA